MSCQLNIFADFHDINGVKNFLFPELKSELRDAEENSENENWDEDWGSWDEQGEEAIPEKREAPESDDKLQWLQECVFSLSPANDIMAIAYNDKCVLLSQKFNNGGSNSGMDTKFKTVWEGSLRQEEGEKITAMMCLPLASQKRSMQGGPDWTCVIVGFSSGYIRFYTETGTLLLSQLLHSEPVQRLKCRTYEPPRYLGDTEQHEELLILFKRAVVTIDGFSLFQSLRACRNQVARATASGSEPVLQAPPLAYKKWALQDQEKILDLCSCGVNTPNPFDQIRTAAMIGGSSAYIRPTPPAAGLFISSGVGPYVGFFYAVEGSTQPILSDVAYAVAHKLKSAIMSAASGWLGFGSKNKEEEKQRPKIEPSTPLPHRFGLPDKRRQGDNIYLSPNNNYVATTDSFGRVILVDVERGTAVRMWKGYRDAQLGWVQVKEDVHHGNKDNDKERIAQFLIIYAPRRGILEVWTAASGPRVAAFNVPKQCRLISPGYGMMGLNNVTCKGVKGKMFQCAIIEPSGIIKSLDIPFHLALSDKNSKRARDLHLLKKLKQLLKDSKVESSELQSDVIQLLQDMRISDISQQGVERVLSTKYLSSQFMQEVLKSCVTHITNRGQDSQDINSKLLVRFCQTQTDLLQMYDKITESPIQSETTDRDITEVLMENLHITNSESTHIVNQMNTDKPQSDTDQEVRRVRFDIPDFFHPSDFLSCFQFQPHLSAQDSMKEKLITVSDNISQETKVGLGKFMYSQCTSSKGSTDTLSSVIQNCSISPNLLLDLLVLYWLSEEQRMLQMIPNLHHILKVLVSLTDKSNVLAKPNKPAIWWKKIRYSCAHNSNVQAAYILALVCRSLCVQIIENQSKGKDPDADTEVKEERPSEGEERSAEGGESSPNHDVEEWNLLVKQLEDVLALKNLLSFGKVDHSTEVSVSKILEGGRGSISEAVAYLIASMELHPGDLYDTSIMDSTERMEIGTDSENSTQSTAVKKLQGYLIELQKRLPHSLENEVLLCNCCWENAIIWFKDLDKVHHLGFAMEYLKLVTNAVLRHGVASMLWHRFVMKKFQALAQLMEKVGKVPKDRLCRKEVGMGESFMPAFAEYSVDLIQVLREANCEMNEVPVFNIEPVWQMVRGPSSLVEQAIEQKMTNYGLLSHHYHLAVIMSAVLTFNMKSAKVLSLFDSKGKHAFFIDFTQHPLLPSQNVDSSLSSNRKEFLARILTYAVSTLDSSQASPSHNLHQVSKKDAAATKWPTLVLEIAKDFGLDLDFFKRQHVIELYSSGHDKKAEEVLLTVNDREFMGSQLLLVAGRRVAHYLLESHKMEGVELLSNVSPTLSTWLRSLEPGHLRKPEADVKSIAMLVHHVANYLPEGTSEYELAISLVDLVQSMH
ncbi:rab3 GTPase-activating protein non-catalytic subunit-like isoform X1 [Saccostrea echinata]|uniref:rab3 GTPase-activating protein non-catalytic subunit-like isoform X1 n=1 Tax=Saccostrea echinata TaxID=191078 RepID=UPI002A83663E|nr:rab3 GTPase-activating protein non-catalytic subunit-like isoform X1 [Saccostrea echinata]